MKIIVTGAAGFIGSHAVERYLNRGHTVVGIDNMSRPGNASNLRYLQQIGREYFLSYTADVRNSHEIERVFDEHRDVALVIHEAGQVAVTTSVANPRLDFESNALGTLNLLETTRLRAPEAIFLFASTNKVYGGLEHVAVRETTSRYEYANLPCGITESEPLDFHSPYGCSKGAAEQYVRDYQRIYGLRTVAFRQSCIYGTRQYGMEDQGWVAWFTIAALLHRPITIYGDGRQVRDILWVGDLIDLYERAVERIDVAAGQIYNAGGGAANSISLRELLAMLEQALGRPIPRVTADWRPGDQRIFIANNAKAQRDLDWAPALSPDRGLPALIEWTNANRPAIELLLARDRARAGH